jgi:hypothetical protein
MVVLLILRRGGPTLPGTTVRPPPTWSTGRPAPSSFCLVEQAITDRNAGFSRLRGEDSSGGGPHARARTGRCPSIRSAHQVSPSRRRRRSAVAKCSATAAASPRKPAQPTEVMVDRAKAERVPGGGEVAREGTQLFVASPGRPPRRRREGAEPVPNAVGDRPTRGGRAMPRPFQHPELHGGIVSIGRERRVRFAETS